MKWALFGLLADSAFFFVVPGFGWERYPIGSWLSLVLFPYGFLWEDWAPFYRMFIDTPSRMFFFFAPFPIYGVLLALAVQIQKLRHYAYALLILHICFACLAVKNHYPYCRWW